MKKVFELCARIDSLAVALYVAFAAKEESASLRPFWESLAAEERTHVAAWYWLSQFSGDQPVESYFEEPEAALARLRAIEKRASQQLARAAGPMGLREMFTATCALELGMLDMTFVRLFDLFATINPDSSAHIDYESHIRHFGDAIRETGLAPELDMIIDHIFEFWHQNRRLADQAQRDFLTGLYNRRGFYNLAIPVAALVARAGGSGGLLMLDLDRFKLVNDTWGHETGDRVLSRLGALLGEHARKTDVTGRFGGEEFIVYLPEADEAGTAAVAEKIRAAVEGDPGMPVPVTVSVGAVSLKHERNTLGELERMIAAADKLLYAAKRNGRNRVESGSA